jgi:hypothetical protein
VPKKRVPSMNVEIMEYLKFLHLHNLVDIIAIIESIPIYYQTQIKKYGPSKTDIEQNTILQKMRLQNITYIASKCFHLSFPNFKFDFQTVRMGPFSLDIENELLNLINSEVFNNAVSSKKQLSKRYKIASYDKEFIIEMFKGEDNYRDFLSTVDNKDIFLLKDIALAILFHNHIMYNGTSTHVKSFYIKDDRYKYKILYHYLGGLVTWKKDYNAYIKELVDLVLNLIQQKSKSLQNLSS